MVNLAKLVDVINSRGMKYYFIADKLGLSPQAFSNKINGKSEFKASEIQIIDRTLKLDDADRKEIFFNSRVD